MTGTQPFPSLIIRQNDLAAQGSFAEAQAEFLRPDPTEVANLRKLLEAKNAGIVAHFYMDPELQGVLSACDWPHIQISDSLLMADAGIKMAERGVRRVIVLGVDFMSENVRAMLDAAGHQEVEVYRVASEPIGCSLAASADALAYGAYLTRASKQPRSLHVVYINTSLEAKARAQAIVPTITCTSSNVVKTVLQAFAQVDDLHVWFGPDTYMGQNLARLFAELAEMDDATIAELHPAHDRQSVASLVERFHHFGVWGIPLKSPELKRINDTRHPEMMFREWCRNIICSESPCLQFERKKPCILDNINKLCFNSCIIT